MNNQIIIYQTEDGQTRVDVRMENETVWLTQAQMAELFQTDRTSIVRHINNIYKTEELEREATCAKIAQVQMEGNRKVTRQVLLNDLRKHTLPKKIWIECCKCLHLQKQIINKNKDKGHG